MSKPDASSPSKPVTAGSYTAGDYYARLGLVCSSLGLLGWFIVLGLIFSIEFSEMRNSQVDWMLRMGNGIAYLLRIAVGIVGLIVCGALSMVGVLFSFGSVTAENKRLGMVGLSLGAVGLVIGLGLFAWGMLG